MSKSQPTRDYSLDLLKGALVLGMVLDHVIKLLGHQNSHLLSYLTRFIDLVTFPTFLFVFGYTTQLAYFSKGINFRKILLSSWKILLAFYISGLAYEVLVGSARLSQAEVLNVLFFFKIPGYSEFLIAFALTILVAAILFKPIELITQNSVVLAVVLVALLATTFVPYAQIRTPQLALLIGSEQVRTFPVLQYFPLFLLGVYCCRQKPPLLWLWIALAGALLFLAYTAKIGDVKRFPPSLPWMLGSIAFTIIWFFGAQWLSKIGLLRTLLVPLGANSLFYLVASNIFIFALNKSALGQGLGLSSCALVSLLIVLVAYYLSTLVRPLKAS